MNTKSFLTQFSSIGVRLTLWIGAVVTLTIVLLFIAIYQNEKEQHLNQIHAQADALLSEMIRETVVNTPGVTGAVVPAVGDEDASFWGCGQGQCPLRVNEMGKLYMISPKLP